MAEQSMKKALYATCHSSSIVQMGENTCKSNEININENLELRNLKGKNGIHTNSFHLITHLNSEETFQNALFIVRKLKKN